MHDNNTQFSADDLERARRHAELIVEFRAERKRERRKFWLLFWLAVVILVLFSAWVQQTYPAHCIGFDENGAHCTDLRTGESWP